MERSRSVSNRIFSRNREELEEEEVEVEEVEEVEEGGGTFLKLL